MGLVARALFGSGCPAWPRRWRSSEGLLVTDPFVVTHVTSGSKSYYRTSVFDYFYAYMPFPSKTDVDTPTLESKQMTPKTCTAETVWGLCLHNVSMCFLGSSSKSKNSSKHVAFHSVSRARSSAPLLETMEAVAMGVEALPSPQCGRGGMAGTF